MAVKKRYNYSIVDDLTDFTFLLFTSTLKLSFTGIKSITIPIFKLVFWLFNRNSKKEYKNEIVLGYSNGKKFSLKVKDLFTHVLVTGKSGFGKSGLMNLLAINLLNNKQQIMLLDPDGQEIPKILQRAKDKSRIDVYSLASNDYILGFNPLICFGNEFERRELVNDLKSILNGNEEKGRSALDTSTGYNVDEALDLVLTLGIEFNYNYFANLLKNFSKEKAVEIFKERQITLIDLSLLLDNITVLKAIRHHVAEDLKYKIDDLINKSPKETQKIMFAVGRIKKLVSNPKLSLLLQSRGLNIWDSLNKNQSVLFDLSDLKDADKYFLGKFIFSKVLLFQKQRVKTQDKSLILLIDEARYIEMPAIAEIISNARKFKMGLILFTQFLNQFRIKEVRESAQNTINTKINFCNEDSDVNIKFLQKREFLIYENNYETKKVESRVYKTVNWTDIVDNNYRVNQQKGIPVDKITEVFKKKMKDYEKYFIFDLKYIDTEKD
jgi:energy-coupling factor transporter ATP-binding protein EcfA2